MKTRNQLFANILIIIVFMFSGQVLADSKAPHFSLPSLKGIVNLKDYAGKVVYLDFWASWCGPCRESFPWMNEISNKYSEHEFVILAINVDMERENAERFLKEQPHNFRILFDPDGEVAMRYDLKGMPSSFIINRQGKIEHSHLGFLRYKKPLMESQIEAMLRENPYKP